MEDKYYNWLREKVIDNEHRDFNFLLRRLFDKEFYWVVSADENRAKDGLYLRYVFCGEEGYLLQDFNLEMGGSCRVLEMILSLAFRGISSISYKRTKLTAVDLFWIMIKNLGFEEFDDDYCVKSGDVLSEIEYILQQFLDRKYGSEFNLFKTQTLTKKWRKMEIWKQMNNWIIENELF